MAIYVNNLQDKVEVPPGSRRSCGTWRRPLERAGRERKWVSAWRTTIIYGT